MGQITPGEGNLLVGGNVVKGAGAVKALPVRGVPVNGSAGEYALALGAPTGGTFTLKTQDGTTAAIAFNALATAVQAAIRALGGTSANFSVSGTAPSFTCFNTYITPPIPLEELVVDGAELTGGTGASVAIDQAGTRGSYGGSIAEGGIVQDIDSGTYYQNNNVGGAIPVYETLVAS